MAANLRDVLAGSPGCKTSRHASPSAPALEGRAAVPARHRPTSRNSPASFSHLLSRLLPRATTRKSAPFKNATAFFRGRTHTGSSDRRKAGIRPCRCNRDWSAATGSPDFSPNHLRSKRWQRYARTIQGIDALKREFALRGQLGKHNNGIRRSNSALEFPCLQVAPARSPHAQSFPDP